MSEVYSIEDLKCDGFLHSRVYEFFYEPEKKLFKVNYGFVDLKKGGAIVDCTLTITGWWNLEVYEYTEDKVVRIFDLGEIPEIDRIIKHKYTDNVLFLTDFGLHNNTAIDYKFTKPKIEITGEFDHD